ncbi:MAG: bifunctional phosphoribosylaminoimidazolecarboxamide formyltransferase/IMP cyclohydrolase [Bacilli bacterium]|nr:bifunctional phosphoribosylaminoimidazolecarboxamide formyltransferase/IMP cyclohydrolase [Bacilli bacterium]
MKRALISVSDKTNVVEFAKGLVENGYEIISTGGTREVLEANNIKTKSIENITGFPEILGGRVKTLHPMVHGGLLALREQHNHIKDVIENKIEYIDIIVVNLYPFKETIMKPNVTFDEAIEQIDIGGPSMLRSGAKNYKYVTVISDQKDYQKVLSEIEQYGETTIETKKRLSAKAFRLTASYDAIISSYLSKKENNDFPENLTVTYQYKQDMRYGENPHQTAALYTSNSNSYSILDAQILNGKPLSYNNIQDGNAAINILKEFHEPTAVALKHMNPCGVASSETILEAYQAAFASDSISIFGGIVALNREVTLNLAVELNKTFLEIIIAPSYTKDALLELCKKKNLRILLLDTSAENIDNMQLVSINGGVLMQHSDDYLIPFENLKPVTNTPLSQDELDELYFSWKVVKHVKSNAIVISTGKRTIGVGAGQMNRVGAAKIALDSAKNLGYYSNLTMASDAFFPFDDVVKLASTYGVSKIIQPGGSIRDQDSIDACNELGIKMVFTHNRHFKH